MTLQELLEKAKEYTKTNFDYYKGNKAEFRDLYFNPIADLIVHSSLNNAEIEEMFIANENDIRFVWEESGREDKPNAMDMLIEYVSEEIYQFIDYLINMQLSPIQKKYLNHCPECGGKMHEVPNNDDTEMYLWCNDCDVSMDSSGGYTK